MPSVAIVRGAFLNPFELQNYCPLRSEYDIEVISSKYPLSSRIELPLTRLWSPSDLPNFPYKYPILNRIYVDCQRLTFLAEHLISKDIVHVAETYFGYTYQAAKLRQQRKIKHLVSTVWETIPHNNEGIRGRKEYKKLITSQVDKFIAVTKRAQEALIKEGIPKEKITQIYMGIDVKRFTPFAKKNTKKIKILCVARLVPEKGVLDLFEVFQKLYAKNRNISLTFVGDGPLKTELKNFKNVSVKSVPYSQIHKEYQKAEIFCLPSHSTKYWEEQFGMCLVEAMACGLPIIASDSGAIPEVVGDAGIIFPQKNKNSLQVGLEKLIYNQNIRQELAKKARKLAEERYNSHKIAKQISQVYQDLLCPSKEN